MSLIDQIEYLAAREAQQRELATRARMPDIIDFHTDLARHYGRLLEEARVLSPNCGSAVNVLGPVR